MDNERWFLFILPGNCFGVGTKEDRIVFVGEGAKKFGWIGKNLADIKTELKELNYQKVVELK